MDKSAHLHIDPTLTWRLLDGEAVIVSPQSGQIRVLNHAGALIWQMAAEAKSVGEIIEALMVAYNISADQAQTDLEAFINDLTQRNMMFREPAG